jgi:hypothetical protein
MKLATLACLSALCLHAGLANAAPGDPATGEPARTEQGAPAPKSPPARSEAPPARGEARTDAKSDAKAEARNEARAEAARGEKPGATGRERRRPSYAACNRASHQRGYHGGRRRRFLIRCRLGYERPRAAQHQGPASAAPVRKP